MQKKLAIIIPALNPPKNLIHYVEQLQSKGFSAIIIVNDGSNSELNFIFQKLSPLDRTIVLHHEKNKGKGQALKTAFHYCLEKQIEIDGVITADADGQHSIEDICNLATEFRKNRENIVLGVRNFKEEHVPKRSYFGNKISTAIFQLLFKKKLADTQTGLRALPTEELKYLLTLQGDRYEYEINMLIYALTRNIPIHEVTIQTIYFNNNSTSYYKAIKDSLKIFHRMMVGFFHFQRLYKKESK